MKNIAFLGLGAMGSRMASNLLAAGHRLTIWNRDPAKSDALAERGAKVASSPREAGMGAEVCFSMLRDDVASEHVWLDPQSGAIHGLSAGAIAVECSSVTPHWIQRLQGALAVKDIACLDAPVVGSRPQAEAAQLIFLVSGSEAIAMQMDPLLSSMGSAIHYVGTIGSAATLKLAVNALLGIQVTALAEILSILRTRELDLGTVAKIFPSLPVLSLAASKALGSMLSRDFAPLFTVDLLAKDLDYLHTIASGLPRSPLVLDAARESMHEGLRRDLGSENQTAIIRLFE